MLGKARPLNSVRLSQEGKLISMYRDDKDDRTFTLEHMKKFADGVVPKDWEIDTNPDFCVDLIYKGDGISTSKESTAHILARRKFGDKYAITNVGDKKGDVLKGENTLSFSLLGTQSDEHCRQEDIPHISVINATDYSLVMAEILNKERGPLEVKVEDLFLKIEDYLLNRR